MCCGVYRRYSRLTRNRLVRFHALWYRKGNLILLRIGDSGSARKASEGAHIKSNVSSTLDEPRSDEARSLMEIEKHNESSDNNTDCESVLEVVEIGRNPVDEPVNESTTGEAIGSGTDTVSESHATQTTDTSCHQFSIQEVEVADAAAWTPLVVQMHAVVHPKEQIIHRCTCREVWNDTTTVLFHPLLHFYVSPMTSIMRYDSGGAHGRT